MDNENLTEEESKRIAYMIEHSMMRMAEDM